MSAPALLPRPRLTFRRPNRRRLRRAIALLTLGPLAACVGNDSTAVAAPTLQIAASSGTALVVQGGNVQVQLSIVRGGSFEGAVDLSVVGNTSTTPLPTGLTSNLVPTQVPALLTTATLTLVASSTLSTATVIPVNVVARGTGVTTASARILLTVTAR